MHSRQAQAETGLVFCYLGRKENAAYRRCRYTQRKTDTVLVTVYSWYRSDFKPENIDQVGINPEVKADELTEGEVNKIRELIDKEYTVEGELRKEVNLNIKRLMEIGCYRGTRHRRNLPSRGQRTRTNARTQRGVKKTVAGRGKKRGATKK